MCCENTDKKNVNMKKKKISEISLLNNIADTDKMIIINASGISQISKGNISDTKKITANIAVGAEFDTGINNAGVFYAYRSTGSHALIAIGSFIGQFDIIFSDTTNIYSGSNLQNKIYIFRKVNGGNIFIKNNTSTTANLLRFVLLG